MGNDTAYKVIGIGRVKIKMFDGIMWVLGNVKHVPDFDFIEKNLISLRALDSLGCKCMEKCGAMKIIKGALVIMK